MEAFTIPSNISNWENKLQIEILDEGSGFPENEIVYIFDKFYRLKNSKAGGSGLGLSIVKGFLEAQEGRISVENRVDGGAKFVIEIETEVANFNSIENE